MEEEEKKKDETTEAKEKRKLTEEEKLSEQDSPAKKRKTKKKISDQIMRKNTLNQDRGSKTQVQEAVTVLTPVTVGKMNPTPVTVNEWRNMFERITIEAKTKKMYLLLRVVNLVKRKVTS